MWINTDEWTWAGFLLLLAQLAWAGAIINLVLHALFIILQATGVGPMLGFQLPIALEIKNLAHQFNNQPSHHALNFHLGAILQTNVTVIGENSVSGVFFYLAALMKLAGDILGVFVLGLIKDVLKPLTQKNPFHPESGKKLYWIGGIICLMTPAKFLYGVVVYYFLTSYSLPATITLQWPLPDFTYLVVGLIILSIAYVFNEGARMAREQRLTV